MANESFEVDTAEVRETARKLKSISDQLSSATSKKVKALQNTVRDNLTGDTADALNSAIADLASDIGKIAAGISKVHSSLNTYAAEVERIDKEAAKRWQN